MMQFIFTQAQHEKAQRKAERINSMSLDSYVSYLGGVDVTEQYRNKEKVDRLLRKLDKQYANKPY